jgi:hypothetical protein
MNALSPSSLGISPCTLRIFDEGRLYTIAEVVAKTRWSRTSIYDAMAAGELSFVKRGATRRLIGADLNAFVARGFHPGAGCPDAANRVLAL